MTNNLSNTININANTVTAESITAQDAQISALSTGVVKSDADGNLSSGLLVGDDVALYTITYDKLDLSSSVRNDDIEAAAGISYSKLNLEGSIINSDVATDAAVAITKTAGVAYQLPIYGALGSITSNVRLAYAFWDSGASTINRAHGVFDIIRVSAGVWEVYLEPGVRDTGGSPLAVMTLANTPNAVACRVGSFLSASSNAFQVFAFNTAFIPFDCDWSILVIAFGPAV